MYLVFANNYLNSKYVMQLLLVQYFERRGTPLSDKNTFDNHHTNLDIHKKRIELCFQNICNLSKT